MNNGTSNDGRQSGGGGSGPSRRNVAFRLIPAAGAAIAGAGHALGHVFVLLFTSDAGEDVAKDVHIPTGEDPIHVGSGGHAPGDEGEPAPRSGTGPRYYGHGSQGSGLAAGSIPKGAQLSAKARKLLGTTLYADLEHAAQGIPGISPPQGAVLLFIAAYAKTDRTLNPKLVTPSRVGDQEHSGLGLFQLLRGAVDAGKFKSFGVARASDALDPRKSAIAVADWIAKNVAQGDRGNPACIVELDEFQGEPSTDGQQYVNLLQTLARAGLVDGVTLTAVRSGATHSASLA